MPPSKPNPASKRTRQNDFMQVRKFFEYCPEAAAREMVMLWIEPPGKEPRFCTFQEFYRDDPDWESPMVLLDVVSDDAPEPLIATIAFGWESERFYITRCGAAPDFVRELRRGTLDGFSPTGEWADIALGVARRKIFQNRKAVARLKRHYQMFRREVRKRARLEAYPRPNPEDFAALLGIKRSQRRDSDSDRE